MNKVTVLDSVDPTAFETTTRRESPTEEDTLVNGGEKTRVDSLAPDIPPGLFMRGTGSEP